MASNVASTSHGSSTPRRAFLKPDWEARMDQVKVGKRDLNRLVLDYLILEGYQSAAQSFAEEAATDLPSNAANQVENASIDARNAIRHAVERGDLQAAREMCNDLDPEILDAHPSLHFHLLTQELIELIRAGKTTDALAFAKKELAPRAERNEEFLKELEGVMTLLVYGATTTTTGKGKASTKGRDTKASKAAGEIEAPEELLGLLSTKHRSLAAAELNQALLSSLSLGGQRGEPRLASLLRLCACGEERIRDEGVGFPALEIEKGEGAILDARE